MTLLPVQDTIGQQTQRPLRQAMQDTHGSRMQRPVPRQEQARRQQQQQPAMQPQLSQLQEESSLPVDMDSQPVHEEQNMQERGRLANSTGVLVNWLQDKISLQHEQHVGLFARCHL